jgi:CheY-like chemotaxis protein
MTRILYVEDDALVARSVMRCIRAIVPDVDVTHVDDYEQAITCLQGAAFDVVLSDYDLAPGTRGSGGSLLTWIEKNLPDLKQHFVFLSSNDACGERGVPWLEKPATKDELAAALTYALRGRK